jgi:hypothetical protein
MKITMALGILCLFWGCTTEQSATEKAATWADVSLSPAGPYLGQTPPGDEPRLFAPGLVSNGMVNRDVAISPDGKEIYWGLAYGSLVTILTSRLEGECWTEPEVAPFAQDPDFACFEPAFSPDGRTLYFLTNRAADQQDQKPGWGIQNIFMVQKETDGWGPPRAAPGPITTDAFEYFPSLTHDGTLYFTRQDPDGDAAVYRSRLSAGEYQAPERLGPEINACGDQRYNAYIARDESYLIFCVQGEPRNIGIMDYYISFRDETDRWTKAVNMGETVNTPGSRASSAYVSPDGKYLFFAAIRLDEAKAFPDGKLSYERMLSLYNSPENGSSDIYWVKSDFIEGLRPR